MNENWKEYPVTKKADGTFDITHTSSAGCHPYNVCPKGLDPAGIYDVAEVAAFWNALPEGDLRKQIEEAQSRTE